MCVTRIYSNDFNTHAIRNYGILHVNQRGCMAGRYMTWEHKTGNSSSRCLDSNTWLVVSPTDFHFTTGALGKRCRTCSIAHPFSQWQISARKTKESRGFHQVVYPNSCMVFFVSGAPPSGHGVPQMVQRLGLSESVVEFMHDILAK